MRIASLLPSATEIVCALGLEDQLIAISHSCSYPQAVLDRPIVTSCTVNPKATSAEIDAEVKDARADGVSLYGLLTPDLMALGPDLIVSQGVCDVCAVSGDMIDTALDRFTDRPALINLEPFSLADILSSYRQVAHAAGARERGEALVADAEARILAVCETAKGRASPSIVFLDWIDPPFYSGHWTHDLIDAAGARSLMPNGGQPSVEADWDAILGLAPDIVVIACCGFGLARSVEELQANSKARAALDNLAAAGTRIEITDGHQHFSNPGPRIIESLERLSVLVHDLPTQDRLNWSTPYSSS